ncbi:MAG: uncharacterized protein A8A55_3468, partial [Amphiamblys sp. WSBS2006]
LGRIRTGGLDVPERRIRRKLRYTLVYGEGKEVLAQENLKSLKLTASRIEHVAAVLAQEKPFCVGRVKNMVLEGYAGNVITKMTIHEDNTMESFVLDGNEDQLSRILEEGDNSIDLGRIRLGGFHVPERRIRRKLRYTLVDGEGKEVLEEESDEEVLEEENDEEEITASDGETSGFDDEEERS